MDAYAGWTGLFRRSVLMLGELRAAGELAGLGLAGPLLAGLPDGDGHPVLVVPGLLVDDRSTWPLRHFLAGKHYAVYGWEQGVNMGPTPIALATLDERLTTLFDLHGAKLSLIGVSLGGLLVRQAAKHHPAAVRQVITLGTPTRPPADGPGFGMTGTLGQAAAEFQSEIARPAPVPTTAVVSRSDGLMDWRRCREADGPDHETVEVLSSHLGLGHNPLSLAVIADRLAQAEGCWKPYKPVGWPALASGPARA